MTNIKIYSKFMDQALDQARASYAEDEVPVGAIVVHENKIIGFGGVSVRGHKRSILCAVGSTSQGKKK